MTLRRKLFILAAIGGGIALLVLAWSSHCQEPTNAERYQNRGADVDLFGIRRAAAGLSSGNADNKRNR